MKINTYGVLGLSGILLMFGIAFLKNWEISWLYFVLSVVICSVAILSLVGLDSDTYRTDRLLWGWSFSLFVLAVGLFVDTKGEVDALFLLVVGVAIGFAIAYDIVLFRIQISHAIGIAGLVFLVAIGIGKTSLFYPGSALILYSVLLVFFLEAELDGPNYSYRGQSEQIPGSRFVWGLHISLILASLGLFADVERFSAPSWWASSASAYHSTLYLGLLLVSFFGGVAIPFMLFREQ